VLSIVDGQKWDKPRWGVTLGHSNGSEELAMRGCILRGRFDVACHVAAGGELANRAQVGAG
jgi:hypothetical protein